jgi:hypothetical protein
MADKLGYTTTGLELQRCKRLYFDELSLVPCLWLTLASLLHLANCTLPNQVSVLNYVVLQIISPVETLQEPCSLFETELSSRESLSLSLGKNMTQVL